MTDSKVTPVEAQAVPDLPVARVVPDNEALPFRKVAWLGSDLPIGTELFTRPTPAAADLREALERVCSHKPRTPAQIDADWNFARAALAALAASPAAAAGVPTEPKLSVWYGKMPESNGRNNWTARLLGNGEDFTLDRSEYPHRVRYAADCVRFIIGELPTWPHILDYESDERTPCHLCGGSGEKDGKPCWGLKFNGTAHNVAASPVAPAGAPSEAVRDVISERERQKSVEGWTAEHDDEHGDNAMAIAAACYALWDTKGLRVATVNVGKLWQWTGWGESWFKPKDQRRNLIRAGALILAEIERLDRQDCELATDATKQKGSE